MRRLALAVLTALVLLLGAAPVAAQIDDREIQIVDLDNSQYPRVDVIVDVPPTFADTDLTSAQFALQEGGVRRDIAVSKLDETTAVVLAIDTSGSMTGEPLRVAQQAALGFLAQLSEQNPVAVIGFGDAAVVASGLTTDRESSRGAVSSLVAGGETTLFDALVASSDVLDTAASADRVAVVVLSDGADTQSSATASQAASALNEIGATLYAVGLETGDARLTELSGLAADVGGRYLPATDLAQLDAVYDDLAARLTNQYRLTFEATSEGTVEIVVTVSNQGNLALVRTEAALAEAPPSAEAAEDPTAAPSEQALADSPVEAVLETVAPGRLQAGWVFWVGAAALFFTFSVIAYSVMGMTKSGPSRRGIEPRNRPNDRKLSGVADWASSLVDRFFLDGRRRGAMNAALDRAGLNVRPGEYIVLTACVSLAALSLGWFVHPLIGLGLAGAIALASRFFVAYLGMRRRNMFASQLDNTLLVLASSLRAGHGVQRALSAVAEESESPTNEEFTRVVAETRIGRDLIEALQGVADRLGNEDFEWVVRAVAINRELGGNLSEVLDNVANTIRERNQLRRQVKALSAEGRLSAMILYVLPFGVAGFVRMTNPGYLSELTESTVGLIFIVAAIIAMIGGGAWIKKIVNVRF